MAIFKSPFPDATIPEMSFTAFVMQNAGKYPDKPALIDGPSGRIITYGQLLGGIRVVASSLHKKGFKKGDVFAIYSPNIPEYAIMFHAVATLGGIVTTVNPLYTTHELAQQCNDCRARYLITVPMFMEKALEAQKLAAIEEVFVFGEVEGATPFSTLLQGDGNVPDVQINAKEDVVVLPYSSGTTGLPKGVMLTHYNLVANLCQMEGIIECRSEDVLIGILPFFHIYGMIVIMAQGLYSTATLVTLPRFEMEMFLKVMQDYKVTFACLVPPIVLALAKHPVVSQYDLSHLRIIFSGAAPLSAELQAAVQQRLGATTVQGYGLTETSPVTHAIPNDPAQVRSGKVGSVGPSLRSTAVRIIDLSSGQDVEVGKEGEILIRGPQVMKGYLNRPDATAQTIDADGWLHTGDVGYVDSDGYLYIVDRVKELIKYKGLQVAPAELEGLLLTHEAVADAAVIPMPNEEAGEIPKAFVVLKPNQRIEAEELMDFIAEQVAPHKKVRALEFVNEIPKSASGKILRRVLVQREREKAQT